MSPRVAVICASPGIPALAPGGASVHLRGIAAGFRDAGADACLWVRRLHRGPGTPKLQAPAGVTVELAPRGRLPGVLRKHRPWDEAVDARAMTRWALRRSREWRPELLYERWSLFAAVGGPIRRSLGIPWVLEVNAPLAWESAWFEGLRPSKSLLRREERTLRQADRVVVVSEALADYVERRGVLRCRIDVRPNGVASRAPEDGRPALPGDAPFVLGYAGTFKPWQGLTQSVARLGELGRTLAPRNLRLELWGDGPLRRAFLEQLAGELPGLDVDWRGWGEPDRSAWNAAWIPLGAWPPPSDALRQRFGEEPPARYFSPLKEVEARAAGLACWYGDERGLVSSGPAPSTWGEIASGILAQALPSRAAAVGDSTGFR